jgi:tRNA (guanine37-N1)-methyltransferase
MGLHREPASGQNNTVEKKPVNTGRRRTYPVGMGLKDQLAEILPPDVLPYVSDHFEVIGDIAVLGIPPELEPYKFTLADAIVSRRKNIVTVLRKTEKISGDSRTACYEILRGETTVTVHREFKFSYRIDVGSSFFSTHMAYERKRVTDQVEPGETVYVPFAGVGPYAIPAAARGAVVYAVEKNPDAFRWLKENVTLNHAGKNCHILQGDALDTAQIPHASFDRLIIPAPYGMDHALTTLLPLLSYGGMAHFYSFKTREQVPGLITAYKNEGLDVTFYSPCGNVAPGVSRWVFDLARPRGS